MFKTLIEQQLECLQQQICEIKKGGAEIEAIAILPTPNPNKKKFVITFVGGRQIESEFDFSIGQDVYINNMVFDKVTGLLKATLSDSQVINVDMRDVIGNDFN